MSVVSPVDQMSLPVGCCPSLKLFVKCRPKLIVRPISLQWGHQSNIEF